MSHKLRDHDTRSMETSAPAPRDNDVRTVGTREYELAEQYHNGQYNPTAPPVGTERDGFVDMWARRHVKGYDDGNTATLLRQGFTYSTASESKYHLYDPSSQDEAQKIYNCNRDTVHMRIRKELWDRLQNNRKRQYANKMNSLGGVKFGDRTDFNNPANRVVQFD